MQRMKKKRSYYIFAGILLLVIAIFTVLSIQNKQAIENPDIKQIGRAELFARGIQRPQGLALDEDGRLFVQSAIDGKISIINRDGKVFDYTYLKDFNGNGMVIDHNDNIWMASNRKVVKVDSFGRVIQEYTGFAKAYDIKLAPDDTIYVSDAVEGRIYTISPKGEKKVFVDFDSMKSSNISNAAGICFDKDFKNLYCVNTYTGDLYKISINQNLQAGEPEIVASGLNKPNFIDADDEGNVYISCLGDNSVVRVDQNSIVEQIDTNGKLTAPSGIVFERSSNNGTLFVASKDSNSLFKVNIGIKNKGKK